MKNDDEVMDLDDEFETIELEDEDGTKVRFELLDVIEYRGKDYIAVLPPDDDSTVIIMEMEGADDEEQRFLPVEDEALVQRIYDLFRDRNRDLFTFE
ncbi:MAG: DUF1292 domain-containing protein [Oscillospiraceae bacterium]|nr:DUF1292 domain-containing protein [Oscillospiraceae bacterium]